MRTFFLRWLDRPIGDYQRRPLLALAVVVLLGVAVALLAGGDGGSRAPHRPVAVRTALPVATPRATPTKTPQRLRRPVRSPDPKTVAFARRHARRATVRYLRQHHRKARIIALTLEGRAGNALVREGDLVYSLQVARRGGRWRVG